MTSVLMAGPLPPAIGGMSSVISDLLQSSLANAIHLSTFDTAKSTSTTRTLTTAILARLKSWQRWISLLRSIRPDIVHIHTCSGLSFFLDGALLVMAKCFGLPVVLHIHGGLFDQFLTETNPIAAFAARAIARAAARVVVLSDSWQIRLEPLLPRAKFEVVANGVPIPARMPERSPGPVKLVLFLGAVSKAKGVEEIVRAALLLGGSAKYVLVGPMLDTEFVAAMRRLLLEGGASDRVEFAGPAMREQIKQWLEKADIFVLPSHAEALPISILEAMAARLPIVATAVGAVPIIIETEKSGLLVEPKNVEQLRNAIGRLINDPELRERLATNARSRCEARFSIDRTVQSILCLYEDILSR